MMFFEKKSVTLVYKGILLWICTAVFTNMLLNFFWSWLIIKGLIRVIAKPNVVQDFEGEEEKEEGSIEAKTILDPELPQSDQNFK